MSEHQFVSVREAAELLGISRRTVYRWLKRGWLTEITLPNGQFRLVRASIDRILTGTK